MCVCVEFLLFFFFFFLRKHINRVWLLGNLMKSKFLSLIICCVPNLKYFQSSNVILLPSEGRIFQVINS